MQVFLPYADNLEKSAQNLDDVRLNKQIVELCQIITAQFNLRYSKNAVIGYAHHPVVQQYNTSFGTSLLLDYGTALCIEYQFRMEKNHQGYFTLLGLKTEYCQHGFLASNTQHAPAAYIKGRKDKDQVITTEHVSELYQKLLSEKWANEHPKWTNRGQPKFYHPM